MRSLGMYTIRGSMGQSTMSIGGDTKRLQLDDGDVNTGFRVRSFELFVLDGECHGTLSTEPLELGGSNKMMDGDDNTQLAWSSNNPSGGGSIVRIDPDYLVIEDLYITGYATTSSQPWNYIIQLEKFSFDSSFGALNMVRNRSQT